MPLKYAVYPGWVRCRFEGDYQYVTAGALMALYRVTPAECLVVELNPLLPMTQRRELLERAAELTPLVPRHAGDYVVPSRR